MKWQYRMKCNENIDYFQHPFSIRPSLIFYYVIYIILFFISVIQFQIKADHFASMIKRRSAAGMSAQADEEAQRYNK